MLSRRQWFPIAVAGALAPAAAPKRRPNVLLIMTDDQGYGDLSCHGNSVLRTPNIDKLAQHGIEFTRFYVSPVCAPTRASLLTGRYNLRTGVHGVTRGRETMRAGEVTIAEALRESGYRTGMFGKWHLGEQYPYVPHAQGFEEFLGFRTGHWNRYFDAPLERNGDPIRTRGFITDTFAEEAIGFMERHRDKPFFLYVPFNAPHTPPQVPDANYQRFANTDLDEPTKVIYGMIENADAAVGRIVAALDRLELADRTILIFLTDNGPNGNRYNAGLRGRKGSVYEGGVRVPFIIRWPERWKKAQKIDTIAAHIDLYPTLLDLCDVARPAGLPIDGMSLRPLMEGNSGKWPDRMIFTHSDRENSAPFPGAVRTQRFSLVNGSELYDVLNDPGETTNVAAAHPDVVGKLRRAYDVWYAEASRQCLFERLPIQVGHDSENPVVLPATQAWFEGQLRFHHTNGYAHDWISGWSDVSDTVWWEVDVVEEGEYAVALRYACPERDAGAEIEVRVEGRSTRAVIQQSTPMDPLPDRNRLPGTHYVELAWATLDVGLLRLRRERTRLTVHALTKPGRSVMHLKEAILRRV